MKFLKNRKRPRCTSGKVGAELRLDSHKKVPSQPPLVGDMPTIQTSPSLLAEAHAEWPPDPRIELDGWLIGLLPANLGLVHEPTRSALLHSRDLQEQYAVT